LPEQHRALDLFKSLRRVCFGDPAVQPFCQARNAIQAFSQTLCSFEKNYRLQDIQLSKSFPSYRARSHSQAQRAGNSLVLAWPGRTGPLPVANRHRAGLPDMVENTGLEPVTSWLQTRRSPS
jgi:hypothetical protein